MRMLSAPGSSTSTTRYGQASLSAGCTGCQTRSQLKMRPRVGTGFHSSSEDVRHWQATRSKMVSDTNETSTLTNADVIAFGEKLAAWAETLADRDRMILAEVVARAKAWPLDQVRGYDFMDNLTEGGVKPG